MFRIQYYDVRVRIKAYVEGNRKKCVKKLKKVPKSAKSQLFGGVILQLVYKNKFLSTGMLGYGWGLGSEPKASTGVWGLRWGLGSEMGSGV